jgi:hypothetical protein
MIISTHEMKRFDKRLLSCAAAGFLYILTYFYFDIFNEKLVLVIAQCSLHFF